MAPANNNQLIASILGSFKKELKRDEQQLFKVFLQAFFERTEPVDLKRFQDDAYLNILRDVWELFKIRKQGALKLHFHSFASSSSPHHEGLALTLINDNKPFLVGSLLSLLQQLGLQARLLLHPVMKVKRASKGLLEALLPFEDIDETNFESLIHCHLSTPLSKEDQATLEKELIVLYQDIDGVVADWPLMRKKIKTPIEEFTALHHPPKAMKNCGEGDFLAWLDDHHFIFLGMRDYSISPLDGHKDYKLLARAGILKNPSFATDDLFLQNKLTSSDALHFLEASSLLTITKSAYNSAIHRFAPMDIVSIKRIDTEGKLIGLRQFIGLFTSEAYNSNAYDIPWLRDKINSVLKQANLAPQWHDGKALIHILNALPRDELFQASEKDLFKISLRVLTLQEQQRLAFFIRPDTLGHYLSCLVYIPRVSFTYELIDRLSVALTHALNCKITLGSASFGNDVPFARIHYLAHYSDQPPIHNIQKLEKLLADIARPWQDNLKAGLIKQLGEAKGNQLAHAYGTAFNKTYEEHTSIKEAADDISVLEDILGSKKFHVRLLQLANVPKHTFTLKLYNVGNALSLSEILPLLGNLDLKVKDEISCPVKPLGKSATVWIHTLTVTTKGEYPLALEKIEPHFVHALVRIWNKETCDDGFNRLVLAAGLSWQECRMFRAYAHYMRQLQSPFSSTAMEQTLVKHPSLTRHLRDLFLSLLMPDSPANLDSKRITKRLHAELNPVRNPDEDRIIRCFMSVLLATMRTNYFQRDAQGHDKSFISFKIHAPLVEGMPKPAPLYEIFIDAPNFEAVHLRGGKVARGGIRWSDRREDFRTEILGLMKAQMVKNSIIVPVGAKGGFVVKSLPESFTSKELKEAGIACYKTMMHGLLELTDNYIKGKIVHPASTVCRDGEDPYLVVAADKGTATFSDYANAVANEHGFWLGDAFASGGSYGYDHKRLGITARGAWESVKRHFYERGLDVTREPITVAGVGDMAGDVFGNGMLMSKQFKLVAAFNHRHIFLDPIPDPAKSYSERRRLFNKGLGWDAYDRRILSPGGAIYERQTKVIKLKPETESLLGLTKATATPDEIIQAILKLPVDLLWFGGIGTFVKAKHESHSDVGDRANDSLRVNGNDLRCKVIGEGANLGVTQHGRIEFARLHGSINTDAIDNSAGVDCSDHEVNVKILLQDPLGKGLITFEERNRLLRSMAPEISALVLRDNYEQNLILSVMHYQGAQELPAYQEMIRTLEQKGKLDRELACLPDDQTFQNFIATHSTLSRPELAVVLAYSKMALAEVLIESPLLTEPFFNSLLESYFPSILRSQFARIIPEHPLRHPLLATLITNHVINRMGASFMQKMLDKTGRTIEDCICAYFIIAHLIDLNTLWHHIESCQNILDAQNLLPLYAQVINSVLHGCQWLAKQHPSLLLVGTRIAEFSEGFKTLRANFALYGDEGSRQTIRESSERLRSTGLKKETAHLIPTLAFIPDYHDIITIAAKHQVPLLDVAKLYFLVGKRFYLAILRKQAENFSSGNRWDIRAHEALIDDLYHLQRYLTEEILIFAHAGDAALQINPEHVLQQWLQQCQTQMVQIDQLFHESANARGVDLALLMVLCRALKKLLEIEIRC